MDTLIAGKLLKSFMAAALFSIVGAWLLAWRYRSAMDRLMREPQTAPAWQAGPIAPPTPADDDAARGGHSEWWLPDRYAHAQRALVLRLLLASALVALSLGGLSWALGEGMGPATPRGLLIHALIKSWPIVPAFGLLWHWSRLRLLLSLLAWLLVITCVVWLSGSEQLQLATVLSVMGNEALLPLVWVMLICMGRSTRAVAPWLILPCGLLCLTSVASLEVLTRLAKAEWPGLVWLADRVGVDGGNLLFVVLPWIPLAWLLTRLARGLATVYERQYVSDLMALFIVLWALCAGSSALEMMAASGSLRGLWLLAPLLWIALTMRATRGLMPSCPKGGAPVLLVLRVFDQDRQVEHLFDSVVERWRLVGPAVLIAGTDLLNRTLDPCDIFKFLGGHLRQRFIHSAADVAPRLAEFQWPPDLDGRWRVNECYCHDDAWREGLAGLLERSDRVLMDLRGFQRRNAGCRHELEALATARRPQRVLLLFDERSDLACAQQEAAAMPPGRCVWLDAKGLGQAALRREVLKRLLDD